MVHGLLNNAKALVAQAAEIQYQAINQLLIARKRMQEIVSAPDSADAEIWASKARYFNGRAQILFKKAAATAHAAKEKAGIVADLKNGENEKLFGKEMREAKTVFERAIKMVQETNALLRKLPAEIISPECEEQLQRSRKGGMQSFNKLADGIEEELAKIRVEEKKAGTAMALAAQKGLGSATSSGKSREARECVQRIMERVRNGVALTIPMQKIIREEQKAADDSAADAGSDAHTKQLSTVAEMQGRIAELKEKITKSSKDAAALRRRVSRTPGTKQGMKPSQGQSRAAA